MIVLLTIRTATLVDGPQLRLAIVELLEYERQLMRLCVTTLPSNRSACLSYEHAGFARTRSWMRKRLNDE